MNIITTGRSALFSPADRPERAAKALAGDADIVILDLEDAVAPDAKATAREHVPGILAATSRRRGVVVRINDPATGIGRADLAMIHDLHRTPEGTDISVMVPKVTTATPLEALPDGVPVIGLIETADAVRDLHGIATQPRLTRLALGAVDLSTQLGCEPESATIDAVRAQLVIASVAAGIAAPLDSPCVNFRDPEVVSRAAGRARRDGFGGLLCIHPAQLPAVAAAFRPSEDEITWAEKVLSAGEAASALDGEMIDRPVILRARRIMEAVEA